VKYGFYELQSVRDWYREVTADIGMHADLAKYWIRVAALLVQPVAPHFSEHIWSTVLKEPKSVQLALWPEPESPVDRQAVEAGAYMRGTIKTIRDAELALLKRAGKGKGGPAPFDPKKPRSVRVYVASAFPEWQEECVAIVKESHAPEADKVDDAKVRQLLTEKGLIKDKRAMPFIQAFKVSPLWRGMIVYCR
jgi:leucyl-tRNA synthetase